MQTITVPLAQLTISPDNVRRTNAEVTDLVASIAAHGLINPLTAVAHDNGYHVIAGGRRLLAIQELGWAAAPVNVVEPAHVTELSLTENISRIAMSTLDTLRALRRITDAREDPAYIAERFGLPIDRARKIARLSCLCDEVLDHWEAEQMSQAEAEAFAATADHDLQRSALKRYLETESNWERSPQRIKTWLGMGDYDARQLLAFVGRDAYEAAGGLTETDLFGEGERICSPELLQQLGDTRRAALFAEVQAQANRPLELIAEKPEHYWQHNVRPERGDLSAPDEARVIELEHLMASLDRDEQEAEFDAAEAEADKLEDSRPMIFPEGGRVGCYIDGSGRVEFYWLTEPAAETDAAAGEAEAEPEDPGLTPTGKGVDTMNRMRRERLIERSTASASMAEAAQQLLLFTVARECFGTSYNHAVAGLNRVHDTDLTERLTFVSITDEAKAWASFRKAFNTEAKRSKLAAEIIARMTTTTARADAPHIALLTQHSSPQPWASTPEFWDLWRKAPLFEMVQEFDPLGEIIGIVSPMKQGDLRDALHDLFSKREKACWKQLTAPTLAAVQAWMPTWLRFPDEQPAPAQLAEAA